MRLLTALILSLALLPSLSPAQGAVAGVTRPEDEIKLAAPTVTIRVPGLRFSDIQANVDDEGYLHLPWIGEYLAALYKFGVAVASIVAVVMIINNALKITMSAGGEKKTEGYKRIAQIFIGLAIAWGSYAILWNINPDLVTFKALKVKYVRGISWDELVNDKTTETLNLDPNIRPPDEIKTLFEAYASCYSLDWNVLKAIAAVESGFNANAVNGQYKGLFQAGDDYCSTGMNLARYPASLNFNCEDLFDPETNTAIAVPNIDANLKSIISKCADVKVFDAATLLYVGHNNGSGVLKYVLSRGACDGDDIRIAVRRYYEINGNPKGVTPDRGEIKYRFGLNKVAKADYFSAKKDALASNLYLQGIDASTCPKNTRRRITQSAQEEQRVQERVEGIRRTNNVPNLPPP